MKFIFNSLLALLWCLLAAFPARASGVDGGDPQRLVTILDYISTDYAGSVAQGSVVNDLEYAEQQAFIATARQIATSVTGSESDPLAAQVAAISPKIDAREDPREIARLCRSARDEVVKRFDLATFPTERPSLPTAQALFAQTCVQCHGETGDGNTALAATLDPRPANFKNPGRLLVLSPYRIFNTLTFGVPGTGMASYEALSPAERWSLAFYVFRLAHSGERVRAAAVVRIGDLARMSDGELRQRLTAEMDGRDVAATVAFLRSEAPFVEAPATDGVDMARRFLGRAETEYRNGRVADAERSLVDAYLQGFEPLEPRLVARDPGIVRKVETAFAELRRSLASGVPAESFSKQIAALDAQLRSAEAGGTRAMAPFVAAFLIVFREGIEAALLVAALLAGARRLKRPDASRAIHAGWLAAFPAGFATWWAFERVLHLGADRRELMEALVALAAAAVLFSVSFWMISKAESRHWMAYLRRNLESTLSRRSLWLVAGLAFLAVYREAAETVLFLQATLLEAVGGARHVWAGGGCALLAALACAFIMNRAIAKLPFGPFFGVSGILLCLLAISFAGSGIYTLVGSGYLKARPVHFPEIAWMGIHPDLSSLLVQLVIVSTIAVGAYLTFTRRPPDGAATKPRPRP